MDSGDPDLYVKYQTNSEYYEWPTANNFDFNSISYKSDSLIISV